MNVEIEIPDELFAFYSAYLKARNTSCGEYLARLLQEDVNAIIESLEAKDIPLVFNLPSSLTIKILTD